MQFRIKGVYSKEYRTANGDVRHYYYDRASGKRLPDDPESLAFLDRLREVRGQPKAPLVADRTLGALMKAFKKSSRYAKLRDTTRKEYDRHMRYLEPLSDTSVTNIRAVHADTIERVYIDKGKATLGAAMRRTLSLLLGFAVYPLDWIAGNPLHRKDIGERRRKSEVGQRPYEEHEIRAFRKANPRGTRARLAFEMDLCTGLRIEDLPTVAREQLLAGQISIITRKSRSHVVLPVSREAIAALHAFENTRRQHVEAGFTPSRYALCTLAGKRIGKRRISGELRDAYIAAGFEESQRTHALRYTAAVRLFELGLHYHDIAEIVGHATAEMAKKYTEKKRKVPLLRRQIDAIDENDLT
jgi:site-specific recombinase XerD